MKKKAPSFWKTVEQLLVKPNIELMEPLQHGILSSLNKSVSLTVTCMNRHKIWVPNSPILKKQPVFLIMGNNNTAIHQLYGILVNQREAER